MHHAPYILKVLPSIAKKRIWCREFRAWPQVALSPVFCMWWTKKYPPPFPMTLNHSTIFMAVNPYCTISEKYVKWFISSNCYLHSWLMILPWFQSVLCCFVRSIFSSVINQFFLVNIFTKFEQWTCKMLGTKQTGIRKYPIKFCMLHNAWCGLFLSSR